MLLLFSGQVKEEAVAVVLTNTLMAEAGTTVTYVCYHHSLTYIN